MAGDGNGWRQGRDPVVRWLRVVAAVVFLGVFVVLSVGIGEGGHRLDALPIIGIAVGALMILLGYEGVIRLPMVGRGKDRDDDD